MENPQIDQGEFDKPKLTKTLNILTILTIIGSAIFLISVLLMPTCTGFSKKMMAKAAESGQQMSPKDMEKIREANAQLEIVEKNMIPYIAINVLGAGLCLFGAVMMRKLKKDGYWLYIAGQVLHWVGNILVLGVAYFTGQMMNTLFMLMITLLFIVLYTTQRKNLIY
jgi:preprotein translocase subunit SecG